MSSEALQLSGTQRAAVFLMALGEEFASSVLKHLGPKEVQKLGSAMASLPSINRGQLDGVVADFTAGMGEQTPIGVGNEEYLRNVMVAALGEERAGSMMDRILVGDSSKGLESLKWMDARAVADVVRHEHPQIIAIVVSYLDSDHAADVLRHLPVEVRGDVIMRIASLESIQPGALEELDGILKRQFAGNVASKTPVVGGLRRAADIVNYMDSASEEAVFKSIGEHDASLVERIQELMFTFDNLTDLDDRSIQRVLREVTSDQLILAMKGAMAEVKALILKNMSKRAGESLLEDLEARGPVRLSEVEAAQKEILATVRRLAETGEVVIGGKGGEQYV